MEEDTSRGLPYFYGLETEKYCLGMMMCHGETVKSFMSNSMDSSWFENDWHKKIFSAIQALFKSGRDIDLISVNLHLEEIGIEVKPDFASYMSHLINDCSPSPSSADYVATSMVRERKLRMAHKVLSEAQREICVPGSDVDKVSSRVMGGMSSIVTVSNTGARSLDTVYMDMIREISMYESKIKVGLGVPSVDKIVGPLFPGEMTIIAGESSIGKTAFVTTALRHINRVMKHPVALFSLEMDDVIMAMRILAADNNVKLTDIREGRIPIEKLMEMVERIKSDKFFIESNIYEIDQIASRTHYLKQKHGIKAVAIDYIQLATSREKGDRREGEISYIGSIARRIAKDCHIHTFALSQLDETWRGKPTKRNLRESKALGHHTDNLIILYKYKGLIRANVDKNRNGIVGDTAVRFIPETGRFE